MEEFKRLKWSWHKYEEDKNYLERNFSFETINDNDALSRNLNEIHTCVIPQNHEFRIFKTPEEIAANYLGPNSSNESIIELKDPRGNKYSKLQDSKELVKEYSYSSELKKHEHLKILGYLRNQTVYNPKIVRNTKLASSNLALPKELNEKWEKEAEHFQRCAEIYYHRYITQNNDLLWEKFKELLIEKWKKLEAQIPCINYQVITMILRNTSNKSQNSINLVHMEDFSIFDKDLYKIPDNLFSNLQNPCMESIKLFLQFREISTKSVHTKSDIHISLDILTKLFVDGTEFNTIFINETNSTKFILNEAVPLKTIAQSDALEEAIKIHLKFNFEWHNVSKCVQSTSTDQNIDFRIHSINETMSNVFKRYKKHAGANNEISLWKLESGSQNLLISVTNNNCYYSNDGHTKVIISIKLEHQTIFGAEQMTREELLKEWIQVKLSCEAIVLRFRIDAKSLEILSIIKLKIEDIENELKELHNYNPSDALNTLFHVFNCIHNLPDNRYIIQAQKNENDCNKLLIYNENHEHGKSLFNDQDFKVSETFTRKWIPIDKKVLTFVHINEEIAPCCFSYKSSHKVSYIMPNNVNKKTVAVKKAVHKSPQKQQILSKRIKRRNKKKTAVKKMK